MPCLEASNKRKSCAEVQTGILLDHLRNAKLKLLNAMELAGCVFAADNCIGNHMVFDSGVHNTKSKSPVAFNYQSISGVHKQLQRSAVLHSTISINEQVAGGQDKRNSTLRRKNERFADHENGVLVHALSVPGVCYDNEGK